MRLWILGLIVFSSLVPVRAWAEDSEIVQLCKEERQQALRGCLEDENKDLKKCEKDADEAIQFNPGCGPTEPAETNEAAIALKEMKAEVEKSF